MVRCFPDVSRISRIVHELQMRGARERRLHWVLWVVLLALYRRSSIVDRSCLRMLLPSLIETCRSRPLHVPSSGRMPGRDIMATHIGIRLSWAQVVQPLLLEALCFLHQFVFELIWYTYQFRVALEGLIESWRRLSNSMHFELGSKTSVSGW